MSVNERWIRGRWVSGVIILVGLCLSLQAWAAEDWEEAARQTGSLLRCPVCQGMPVADSPSEMALSMMARIEELHREGKSQEEVIAYFVERYGEWVMLEPSKEGMNAMLWVLPLILFLLGLLALGRLVGGEKNASQ